MRNWLPFLGYVALVAYLPLVLVTARTVSLQKLRDLTFVRTLAKDYLRTVPTLALVVLPVTVPAALAVNAVEGTYFPVHRQEVDAQGRTQAAAVYRPEYGFFP